MTERELRGVAVSTGVAVGPAFVTLEEPVAAPDGGGPEAARAALAGVAAELARTEERLIAAGRKIEAEIVAASRLMADDPSLAEEVEALAAGLPAAEALRAATERHATALASVGDPLLAARAADVRELGRRAVRALSGGAAAAAPLRPSIVVARELGPAELLDFRPEEGLVLGIALAEGSATSHAAIIARSLGVPMVAALGEEVLAATGGDELIVDGTKGTAVLNPGAEASARVRAVGAQDAAEHERLAAGRGQPAVTAGGRSIRLLANASSPAEVDAALRRGAEGVGLVRTELAFLDSPGWPTEDEHYAALAPVLAPLEGRIATVRTLDFGGDKTPPFLRDDGGRGIALMLEHEDALVAQLAAILRAGAGTHLRIMLPLVESPRQLVAARRLLRRVAASGGYQPPQLGAMVETPRGATRSAELAAAADFFSIGTNDLVATTLGLDRDQPAASPLSASDPAVVALIRRTIDAAHATGISVEICGEAAGEPALTPLLVGLGVDELSVSPARLDAVRDAIRRSGEPGDEVGQLGYGLGGVVA
jgi:phosphoenolpyruvate-protein kinase (PTS system EI component)